MRKWYDCIHQSLEVSAIIARSSRGEEIISVEAGQTVRFSKKKNVCSFFFQFYQVSKPPFFFNIIIFKTGHAEHDFPSSAEGCPRG